MGESLTAKFEKRFATSDPIRFETELALDRFGLVMLLGPSGCGKTTSLRCLAGLIRPEAGTIAVGSRAWFDRSRGICLTPQARDIGFMFQDYALFPHLNVVDNIGFGLSRRSGQKRQQRIQELIDRLELNGLEKHLPFQLSGGEQQRVALARAVARKPKLLLLDEPLSALDDETRARVRPELKKILQDFGIPVIMVTHDRLDALSLGDHLVVMKEGSILEQGPLAEVFAQPRSRISAKLLGMDNLLPARISNLNPLQVAMGDVKVFAALPLNFDGAVQLDQQVVVGIWSEEVQVGPAASPLPADNALNAKVKSIVQEGPTTRLGLDCGFPLVARVRLPREQKEAITHGQTLAVSINRLAVHLMKE